MIAFDELTEGRQFQLGRYEVTREAVIAFAAEFDPQPFHLDEAAAAASMLGGLSASGWQTCGIMMRLLCDSLMSQIGSQGSPGIDFVSWKRPVRPGDTLSGTVTILGARRSASRPTLGLVRMQVEMVNQREEVVLDSVQNIFVALDRTVTA